MGNRELMTIARRPLAFALEHVDELTPDEQRADTIPPVKRCGCGVAYSVEAWAGLPYVGIMADEHERLELRNCRCGSTIAIELARGAA